MEEKNKTETSELAEILGIPEVELKELHKHGYYPRNVPEVVLYTNYVRQTKKKAERNNL